MRPRRFLAALLPLLAAATIACGSPTGATLPALQIFPRADLPPGRLLFVKDGNVWIWADGRARQLTDGGTWQQPQWSPDGSEIVYVYRATNFSDIFVMNADGSDSRRLTRGQSSSLGDNDWSFRPTWSPTGAQIAYITDSSSFHPTVWLMNRDGSGKRPLLAVGNYYEAADAISWAPDGRRLAVTAFGQEVSQIVLLDVARGTTQPITDSPRGAIDPAFSPDGTTLAYAVREGGRMEIRARRLEARDEVTIVREGLSRGPTWSPDGTRLAYLSSRGGSFEVYTVELTEEAGLLVARNDRQLTRDLNLDATSGLSWGR